MNKTKKLVSLICSIAMIFTMMANFTLVSAADAPGMVLEYDGTNSTETKKVINAKYVGFDDGITSFTVQINIPDTVVSATATAASGFIATDNLDTTAHTYTYGGMAIDNVKTDDNVFATIELTLSAPLESDFTAKLIGSSVIAVGATEYSISNGQLEASEVVIPVATETENPSTEAPSTEAPATEAPATEAPSTEAPATETPSMVPADPRPTQMPSEETEAPATEAPATEVPSTEAPATETPATAIPTMDPIDLGIALEYDTVNSTETKKVINAKYVGFDDGITSFTVQINIPDTVVSATATAASGFIATDNLDITAHTYTYGGMAIDNVKTDDNVFATIELTLSEDVASDFKAELIGSSVIAVGATEYSISNGKLPAAYAVISSVTLPVETETPATEAPATEAPATVAPTAAPTEKPIIDTVELSDLVSASAAREAEAVEGAVVYVTTHVTSGNDTLVYGTDYVAKIGNTVLTEKEYTDRIWAYDGNKASDAIDDISLVFYKSADVAAKLNVEGNPYAIDYGTTKVEEPDTPSTQYKFTKWTKTGSSSSITSDSITRGYSRTYVANFNNFDEDTQYIKYEITSGDRYIDLVELADTTKINVEASTVGTARIKATLYDEATDKVLAESTTLSISVKSATSSSGSSSSSGSGSTGGSSIGQIAGGNLGNVSITDPGVINGNVNFQDLDQAAWARDAIVYLAQRGIINGRSSTEFAPNDSITRAEFAQLVINMYGLNKITSANVNVTSNFADVQSGTWYYNAVNIAANLGIVNGYPDGNFYPNNLVSRQEMALMMYRVANKANAKLTAVNEQKVWSDPVADWAADAVTTLQMAGVINGTSDTTFEAEAGATRAQAAQMIYNLYQVIK